MSFFRKRQEKRYIKKRALLVPARRFNIKILVETGTYEGETVEAMKNKFEKIYSIELDDILFKRAQTYFREYDHIKIIQGDSTEVLPEILKTIQERVVFWLDGHYSGGVTARGKTDTPIVEELNTILKRPFRDVIVIDDARCFTGENDYPTVEEVKLMVQKYKQGYAISVHNDIIHILPYSES